MKVRATVFARDMTVYSIVELDIDSDTFKQCGMSVIDLCAEIENTSKSAARRLIEGGGVRINNIKVVDPSSRIARESGENLWEFVLYECI